MKIVLLWIFLSTVFVLVLSKTTSNTHASNDLNLLSDDMDEGIYVPAEHLEEFERNMLDYDYQDDNTESNADDEYNDDITLDFEIEEAGEVTAVTENSVSGTANAIAKAQTNVGAAAYRTDVAVAGAASSAAAAASVVGAQNQDPLKGKYLQRVKKMIWCLKPDSGVLFPQDYYYPFGYGQRFHRARRYHQVGKKYSPYGRYGDYGYRGYIYRKMMIDERFTPMPEETVVEEVDNPDEYRRKLEGKRKKRNAPDKGGPTRGKDLVITRCYKFGDQKICCKNKKQTVFGSDIGVTRNTND